MTHSAKTQTLGQQEAAAWRSIAEQIDADMDNRWQFICNIIDRAMPPERESLGTCYVDVTWDMRYRMKERLKAHDFGGVTGVPYPWNLHENNYASNRARVLACLWLAYEAEEEG